MMMLASRCASVSVSVSAAVSAAAARAVPSSTPSVAKASSSRRAISSFCFGGVGRVRATTFSRAASSRWFSSASASSDDGDDEMVSPESLDGYLGEIYRKRSAQAERKSRLAEEAARVGGQDAAGKPFSWDWEDEDGNAAKVAVTKHDDRLLPIYDEQFDPDEWMNVVDEDIDALMSPQLNEGMKGNDDDDAWSAFRGVAGDEPLFRPFAEAATEEISPPGKVAMPMKEYIDADELLLNDEEDDEWRLSGAMSNATLEPKLLEFVHEEGILDSDDEEAAKDYSKPMMAGDRRQRGSYSGPSERERQSRRPFNLKKNRRGNLPDRPGFHCKVIQMDRVVKVTTSKKVNTIRALVVAGNRQGTAGFGLGRGRNAIEALKRARRIAMSETATLVLSEGGCLDHNCVGLKNNSYMYFEALPPGYGLRASGISKVVCEAFGIKHAKAYQKGRRNRLSMVQAAFKGLANHTANSQRALVEGKKFRTRRTLGPHEYYPQVPKPAGGGGRPRRR